MKRSNASSRRSRKVSVLDQNVATQTKIMPTSHKESEATMKFEYTEQSDSMQALALADLKRILASRLLVRWLQNKEATPSTQNIA